MSVDRCEIPARPPPNTVFKTGGSSYIGGNGFGFGVTGSASFSLSGWVKAENWGGATYGNCCGGRMYMENGHGTPYLGIAGSGGSRIPSPNLPTNQWCFFVTTVDTNSNHATLYFRCKGETSWRQGPTLAYGGNHLVSTQPFGAQYRDNGQVINNFNGWLDEFATWDKVLSEAERNAAYNNGEVADLARLGAIHWWNFQNVEGNQITDQIGTLHGTIQNANANSGLVDEEI